MITFQHLSDPIVAEVVPALVARLVDQMKDLWWSTERSLPDLGREYSIREQSNFEKELVRLMDGLEAGLKRAPSGEAGHAGLRVQIQHESFHFIQSAFGFEDRQLELIQRYGLIDRVEQFSGMARRYDPLLSSADIYQASRNVSSMNLMQLLLGLPVEITPSVFAYSMLYPYTDNYLDDPAISSETKMGFNRRFWNRLAAKAVLPAGGQEKRIWEMIEMVEGQYDRSTNPDVYASLLAIHEAQTRSLSLLRSAVSPYDVDVLGISIEKGGTSVLADGYLVAGQINKDQATFMFGYGAFTQLMDDLEDLEDDRKAGMMTIFSQTAGHFPLDGVMNRLYHLGKEIFEIAELFPVGDVRDLQDLIQRALLPLLCFSAAHYPQYFSRDYLATLERHMPLRPGFLRSQQKKFARSQGLLYRFMERGATAG